ncbi:hypothetical protein K402DRAFT_463359 [Aulographum hederae CBS 113979]|uniref:Uncharacterized protein n=1 Tax=Aulographum hederae CBS 113979 TaxID=1176131 RepID=A0A6G1H1A5_9PEZI|nr:hypothetical protein K402DRAFT_463359 [Aulographum hederae CBS 113979]
MSGAEPSQSSSPPPGGVVIGSRVISLDSPSSASPSASPPPGATPIAIGTFNSLDSSSSIAPSSSPAPGGVLIKIGTSPAVARPAPSSTSSAISYPQPTTAIPLTTTFTPPASCIENRLSMMPPPGWMIWANEPVPAPNVTVSDCYPREFLQSYTSVSSSVAGSSVVPAMSPLICPIGWCTMYAGDANYAACCPSGYQLHRPDTTFVSSRPGYGGTCYSDLTESSTVVLSAYNTEGAVNRQVWTASSSGAQAYAHVIDGYALTEPNLDCGITTTVTPDSSSSQSPIHNAIPPPHPSATLSGGAIAGIVVSSIAAASFIFLGIVLLLRRRHLAIKRAAVVDSVRELSGDRKDVVHEKGEWDRDGGEIGVVEMPGKDGDGVAELEGDGAVVGVAARDVKR